MGDGEKGGIARGKKILFSSSGVKHPNFLVKLHGIPTAFRGMGSGTQRGVSKGGDGSDSRKQLQGSNINLCKAILAILTFVIFLL